MLESNVLLTLPPATLIHIAAALIALVLGPFAIYRARRDRLHKTLGYVWVIAILVIAGSSFAIHAVVLPIAFGFGVIHLLSIWATLTVILGVNDARHGRIAAHRGRMAGLYWQGLSIAGLLTLLPGRVMNEMIFPDRPVLGVWAILGLGVCLLWVNLRDRLPPRFRTFGQGNPPTP